MFRGRPRSAIFISTRRRLLLIASQWPQKTGAWKGQGYNAIKEEGKHRMDPRLPKLLGPNLVQNPPRWHQQMRPCPDMAALAMRARRIALLGIHRVASHRPLGFSPKFSRHGDIRHRTQVPQPSSSILGDFSPFATLGSWPFDSGTVATNISLGLQLLRSEIKHLSFSAAPLLSPKGFQARPRLEIKLNACRSH